MNLITRPTLAALLLLTALTTTTVAQQKRHVPAKPQPKPAVAPVPAPTFDTLVPADSYTIYGEVRGVGQLIQSNALHDILQPIMKLGGPPKEFKTLLNWLNAHADEVMTSRLLFAAWPTAKDLPPVMIAIEFASAEEAAKFTKPFNEFLTSVLPPVAGPPPESADDKPTPPKPGYYLQQAGSLVLLTPEPLSLKKLRAAGSKPLTEDVNFRAAHNRFNSEPVFVFIDFKQIERQDEERRKQYETERKETERKEAEQKEAEAAKLIKEQAVTEEDPETSKAPMLTDEERAAIEAEELRLQADAVVAVGEPKEGSPPAPGLTSLSMLGSSFFSGETKWPEGIGLALSFDDDSFDLRALLVNQPGEKSSAIPFMPILSPGSAFVPESPNILPANTELFLTMSLDLAQIYATMSKPRPNTLMFTSSGSNQALQPTEFESPFAAIEKQLKINIKDDVLPLLGPEIALGLPMTNLGMFGLTTAPPPQPTIQPSPEAPDTNENSTKEPQPSESKSPVLLISVKDKEAVKALMPKLIDAMGFKGASSFGQTERKEDTELVSFAGLFSYAFVGNFLVLSGSPATTRQIVDSYLKHETLASDTQFKNYTRWQPRPAQGQAYISPALMGSYKTWAEQLSTRLSDEARGALIRLSTEAQPITYSLSNEGLGPLHELHLPKNLVLMAVTGISAESNPPPSLRNERAAVSTIYSLNHVENEYKKINGSYGTLEQLIAAEMLSKESAENSGYRFDITISGEKFEVSAVPIEYGKTGKMSYLLDQAGVLRGGDHNGGSATSTDPPVFY
jgi:hypothetical protein